MEAEVFVQSISPAVLQMLQTKEKVVSYVSELGAEVRVGDGIDAAITS